MPEYYDDSATEASATPLLVVPEQVTVGIDATLTRGAAIEGDFTDATTGQQMQSSQTMLERFDGEKWVEQAASNARSFSFRRLHPGTYRVRASGSVGATRYGPVYFANELFADLATPISLAQGERRTISISGYPWASIEGTVTSAQSGWPRSGVVVTGYVQSDVGWRALASATTKGGHYELKAPFRGATRLVITDPTAQFKTLGWPDGDSVDSAQDIVVMPNETRSVDASMQPIVGTLTGTVKSTSGNLIVGAKIDIYYKNLSGSPYTEAFAETVYAGADGVWVAEGLEPGDYVIRVSDPTGEHQPVASGVNWTEAYHLGPSAVAIRDVTLPRRASVEGTIRSALDGTPIAGVTVDLALSDHLYATATTDAEGHYRFEHLDPYGWWGGLNQWSLAATDTAGRFEAQPIEEFFPMQPGESRTCDASLSVRPTVVLSTTSPVIGYGSAAILKTRMTMGTSGMPMSDRPVTVQRWTGSKWATAGATRTDSAGWCAVAVRPTQNTTYRASIAATTGCEVAVTAARTVSVKASLSVPSAPTYANVGRGFALKGVISPRHTSGTRPVIVQCYRYVSGRWRLVRTMSPTVSNFYSYSRYSTTVALTQRGRWRIRAYHADVQHAANASGWRYMTVR